jgi:hypothetical protein
VKLAIFAVTAFMLFGVLGLATCRIQEAANKASCQNNLKQITLATIKTADDDNGRFPLATMPHPTEPPYRRLSWMLAIYRNMECSPVYNGFDKEQSWESERNLPHSHQRIKSYICPGGIIPKTALACGGADWAPTPSSVYVTHYVGISGVGQNAAFLPLSDPHCGAFGHERRAHYPTSFTDGRSQTMLIIETADRNGPWAAGDVPTLRYVDPDLNTQVGRNAPFGRSHSPAWAWRPDPATLHATAGMADGSVRRFSSSTTPSVIAAAATIAGDDLLGSDW